MTPLWLTVAALHLGRMHAQEQLLVLLVAFGPFVVLVGVVLVIRRREQARSDAEVEQPALERHPGRRRS